MGFVHAALRIRRVSFQFPEQVLPAERHIPQMAPGHCVYCAGRVEPHIAADGLIGFELNLRCHPVLL